MIGIGGGEFFILIILAIVLFGPEKIPEFSRKAARVVHYLRTIANNATSQLREELGPEYANLTISDLNPKTWLQKTLLDDMQSDIDEIKNDLGVVKAELEGTTLDAEASSSASQMPGKVPFDPEAT